MVKTERVAEVYGQLLTTEDHPTFTYDEIAERYPANLPQQAVRFDNLDDLKRRVTASGSHYFDADAVRFFRAKTDTKLFGGRFWVESRKFVSAFDGHSHPREYMVAYVTDHDGFLSIEKVGSFSELIKARWWARELFYAVRQAEEGES